jgi:hypothetical protein
MDGLIWDSGSIAIVEVSGMRQGSRSPRVADSPGCASGSVLDAGGTWQAERYEVHKTSKLVRYTTSGGAKGS